MKGFLFSDDYIKSLSPQGAERAIVEAGWRELPVVLVIPDWVEHAEEFLGRVFKVGRPLTELYAEYGAVGYPVEAKP